MRSTPVTTAAAFLKGASINSKIESILHCSSPRCSLSSVRAIREQHLVRIKWKNRINFNLNRENEEESGEGGKRRSLRISPSNWRPSARRIPMILLELM